ncbi:DinB family protein [Deinococcus sp.]|uniref:DinB family protein n=1 Tax=Deinococcus sp. TaxID=47478 RepID=UPI003C7DED46
MDKWKHLFYGEYAERSIIFGDLTLQQVIQVPSAQSHSIYAELWHTVLWQKILVTRDETLYEDAWQKGERYPQQEPTRFEQWTALVEEFFLGLDQALEWTATPERLNHETDPGTTMADVLCGLAVHNAYHLGKIVAIRQVVGAWRS